MKYLFLSLFLLCISVGAELIPSTNRIDWTPGVNVGVLGGIVNRTENITNVVTEYGMDNTGATDCGATWRAILAGLTASSTNTVLYFPAGTYLFTSQGAYLTRPYVTIRGAGNTTNGTGTIIDFRATTGSFVQFGRGDSDTLPNATKHDLLADADLLSTSITVDGASSSWIGCSMYIHQLNGSQPLGTEDWNKNRSIYGYPLPRQYVYVTDVSGNTVSFFPRLYDPYYITNSAKVAVSTHPYYIPKFSGIEDMYIDCHLSTSGSGAVIFNNSVWCWAKNVTIYRCSNKAFYMSYANGYEVRECTVDGQQGAYSSNHGGVMPNYSGAGLIEDNIFENVFPTVEINANSSGSVIAYNYIAINSWISCLNLNHGPHNSYWLIEGNVTRNVQSDGYYGSGSEFTVYRNLLTGSGTESPTTSGWCLSFNRFTRNSSIVGNIVHTPGLTATTTGLSFGNPNMGNGNFDGYGPPWLDHIIPFPGVYVTNVASVLYASSNIFYATNVVAGTVKGLICYYNTMTNQYWTYSSYINPSNMAINAGPGSGVYSNVAYSPGASGWQELDTNVLFTTTIKGNYYSYGSTNDYTLGGDTLSNSLYLVKKPAFFGSMHWPPFDPYNVGTVTVTNIPAAMRYYGYDVPTNLLAPVITITAPTNGSKNVSGNVIFTATISSDTGIGTNLIWYINDIATFTNTASPWTYTNNLVSGQWTNYCYVETNDGTNGYSSTNIFTVAGQPSGWLNPIANFYTGNKTITGNFTASLDAPITNVYYVANGISIGSNTVAPYSLTYNFPANSWGIYPVIQDTNFNIVGTNIYFLVLPTPLGIGQPQRLRIR